MINYHQRARFFGYVAIAMVAGLTTPGVASAAERQCSQRAVTSPAIEELAEISIRDNAAAQGHTTYGGDIGRPPPKKSAIDIKRSWAKFVLPAAERRDPAIMFFTIYNRTFPGSDREVINLPFDTYWCVASKGDFVLLSEAQNDHYARIAAIDRERQTVDLIDRWPNILLDFGRAPPAAIKAQIGSVTATLIRFSRIEFEALFKAAIILDTADFVHLLEREISRETWTPELTIAVGRSLLYAGKYKAFPDPAADFIVEGVRAARRAGNEELVNDSIPAMFAALTMSQSIHLAKGDGKAEIARKQLEYMAILFGPAPMRRLEAEDDVRIGVFASAAGDWRTAVRFFRQAIEKNPRDHRGYFFRSETWRKVLQSVSGTRDEALMAARQGEQDAETALKLITEREREFAQRIRDGNQNRSSYRENADAVEEDQAEHKELVVHRGQAARLRDKFHALVSELDHETASPQTQQSQQ
jgi:hypothetical protein